MHDPSNSTAQSDPNIDLSVGSAQNRTEQGDESGELGEEDVAHQYVLGVPIALPLPCRFCAGRSFNTHAGLSKHLKKDHTPQNTWNLAFRCNGCRQTFTQLRTCNAHQKKSAQCQGAQPIQEERHQPQHANVVRQVRPRAPRLQEPVSPAQPAAADQSGTTPSGTGARTDRMQCRRESDVPSGRSTPPALVAQRHSAGTASPNGSDRSAQTARSRTARQSQTPPANLVANAQPEPHDNQTGPVVAQRQQNAQQREWVERFNAVASAEQLDDLLDEFTNAVRQQAQVAFTQRPAQQQRRPRPPPNQHGRRRNQMNADDGPPFDPVAAARIQKLYRASRSRAYREITEQASPLCQLSAEVLHEHFTDVFGPSPPVAEQMPNAVPFLEPLTDNSPFTAPFNNNEVSERLKRCSNTAPGPDNIRYAVWKKFDPGCHVLTTIFNVVKQQQHIPTSWRRSTTVLIHKKGDREDVNNWRPIALSNTIGKLHSAVLANRLAQWAIRNKRISRAQKGFMPVDGCSEHNFMLQSILQDARRERHECAIAWLDLTNAFGSIPHEVIFRSLKWSGLDNTTVNTIRLLYNNNATRIRHTGGLTDDITIHAGVKQGCPLSPIIFNLALEPILRALESQNIGYQIGGQTTCTLAYADDLVLVSNNTQQLQQLLTKTGQIADWAHLRFNPKKCATLVVDGRRRIAQPTTFTIQGGQPPAMNIDQHYEHLGVPTGFQRAQSADHVIQQMSDHVDNIDRSLLAPWQKFDAVNTFVLPSIAFHLKNGEVRKAPLNALDKKIVRVAKRWLNLPQRAGIEPLYLSNAMGGLALTPLNTLADLSQLVHGLRLLTSRDLAATTMDLLCTVVAKRLRRAPRQHELAKYLNGSMDGDMNNESTDISSTWTRLRMATRRLRTKIGVEWSVNDGSMQLLLNGCQIQPKSAEFCLRSAIRDFYHRRLLSKPDQGKAHSVTSVNAASNHFLANGNFTRFADWRFIHRARLDCVPLNGTRRFGQPNNKQCRRCGFGNETLPHVLCHCPPMLATIGRRHNVIMERLVKAFQPPATTVVRVNQTVPNFPNNVRPDIFALDNALKTALIVDICMPFENRYGAFEAARNEKRHKYDELAQHLRQQGLTVFLDAFVVGPLGGWDPHNELVLNRMHIGQHYRHLMRKLMVSDAIKWSRDIYVEHITGTKQYNDWPMAENGDGDE